MCKENTGLKTGRSVNTWVISYTLAYDILIVKFLTLQELGSGIVFGVYSVLLSPYISSRFALAYFYEPGPMRLDPSYEPTISFGIPAKNEEANIEETILRIAATDYPSTSSISLRSMTALQAIPCTE